MEGRRPPHGEPVKAPLPAPRPPRSRVRGRTVHLTPLEPTDDVDSLWAATHGEPERDATWRFMGYGPFQSIEDYRRWVGEAAATTDPMWFLIRQNAGPPIGMATLMRITPAHGAIEVGNIWFVPEAQGTTASTEATFLLMRHAIESGYRRLEWKCDAANLRSRRAALRLGFRFEGVFANHMVVKGRNRDTAWFSITAEEWPEVEAVIAGWLDVANFDGEGRARSSLSEAIRHLW